jgi:epidermal growth factor receptor substrate 15
VILNFKFYISLILFAVLFLAPVSSIAQSEAELASKADAFFKSEKYTDATPLYLRLLSLNPRDHNYNYRYGTCLLFNSDKKQDAFKYLNYAVKGQNIEPEVYYYLGKTYHLTYDFNKAIQNYEKYKQIAGNKAAQNLDVNRQIEMCNNGKKLISQLSEVIVINKKTSTPKDFYRLYDLSNIGGTILLAEDFQSRLDKKNNHVPLIHFPSNPKQIYYSSYGDDGRTEKDIFVRRKLPDGSWSKEQKVAGGVNTNYDEDFPYMHPNGKYLYFSSKGHNSMGGYDIFRAEYFADKDAFGEPVNLDFAISSPDDDLFYVVDSLNKNAYFASNRQSKDGNIHVYQVSVQKPTNQIVIFKGDFVSKISPDQKVISISVKDLTTDRHITTVKTDKNDGGYLITLPNGGKYEYTLQIDGSPDVHLAVIEAPIMKTLKPLKQRILAYEENEEESVRVDNLFNESFDDVTDILAQVMKMKSQLQPNSEAFDLEKLQESGNTKELLATIGLQKYNIFELSDLANEKVRLFEFNRQELENEKAKQLMIIEAAIQEAKEADANADKLLIQATQSDNLMKANSLVDQALGEKFTSQKALETGTQAIKLYNELEKELKFNKQHQDKIVEIESIFKGINDETAPDKLLEVIKKHKQFAIETFSTTTLKSGSQTVYEKTDKQSSLTESGKIKADISKLKSSIDKRAAEIKSLENQKEGAKKKDADALDQKINSLSRDNEADNELLGHKQKELKKELSKEAQLVGTKTAVDKARGIIETDIKKGLDLALLTAQLEQAKQQTNEESVNAFQERTELLRDDLKTTIVALNAAKNASASTNNIKKEEQTELANTTTSKTSTTNTVKPQGTTSSNASTQKVQALNPQLKKKEEELHKSNLTEQEISREKLAIEKQWVFEISKEINKLENELQSNPDNSDAQSELLILREELSVKKRLISELNAQPIVETPIATNSTDTSNSTKSEIIAIDPITTIAAVSSTYSINKENVQNIQNINTRLIELNKLDEAFIDTLETYISDFRNDGSPEKVAEKKMLLEILAELNEDVKDRRNMLLTLQNEGITENVIAKQLEKSTETIASTETTTPETTASTNTTTEKPNNQQSTQQNTIETNIVESNKPVQINDVAVTKLLEELKTLNESPNSNPEVEINKHKELLVAVTSAIEKTDAGLKVIPNDKNLIAQKNELTKLKIQTENTIAEIQQTITSDSTLAQTPALSVAEGKNESTISDVKVNQLATEIEQLNKSNTTTPQTKLAKQNELLNAVNSAIAKNETALKSNPNDAKLLEQKRELATLKAQTENSIAEIQQTIASDSTLAQTPALSVAEGKNESTISDVKVNQLATEIEQLNKSNTTTPQTKLAKQNELLNAVNSAIAKNEAALKSNPTDKKLLEQKRELATLKTETENSIAEIQQTIASDSTLAQTPALSVAEGKNESTITDVKVNQLTTEIEQLNKSNTTTPQTKLAKQNELLNAVNSAIAKNEAALKSNPTDKKLLEQKRELAILKAQTENSIAEIQQTIASDSTLAQTPALSVAEGKNESTISDVKVNQLGTEIEQLNKSNTTTPQTKLAKQNELLNAVNSAIAKNETALKSNPTDKKLLEQKRELATLKTETENSIAEIQQTIASDSTLAQTPALSVAEGKNESTISDVKVNQLGTEIEQLNKSNTTTPQTKLAKQNELLNAINSAIAKNETALKSNPTDKKLLEQKRELATLKAQTENSIAEIQQTIASDSTLAQTPALSLAEGQKETTISDVKVNQLATEIEQLNKSNTTTPQTKLAKQNELLNAVNSAIAKNETALKSNPTDKKLLEQKRELATLKTETENSIAEIQQTIASDSTLAQTPALSVAEGKNESTITDVKVNQLATEIEQLNKSNTTTPQTKLAKQNELLNAVNSAIAKNETALKSNPTDKKLLEQKRELATLKTETENSIAEIQQTIASDSTLAQTPALSVAEGQKETTISDVKVNQLAIEIEQLNKSNTTTPQTKLAKQNELLNAINSAIAKNETALKSNPTDKKLLEQKRELATLKAQTENSIAETQQTIASDSTLAQTPALSVAEGKNESTITDVKVNQLATEIEQLNKSNTTTPQTKLAKQNELLNAINSAIAKNETALKSNPTDKKLLEQKRELATLKAQTENSIAETQQTIASDSTLAKTQNPEQKTTITDVKVNQLATEIEQLNKSNTTTPQTKLTKQNELLNAVYSAIAKNEAALKSNPTDKKLLEQKRELATLKTQTENSIAEIQQTIASDSTLAQTPALSVAEGQKETTISDVKVNQLATEIEQLNKSNTTTPQTKLAKQNELLNAVNSAIAKNETALKSNPTDKKLLEQKRELATLKAQTENSITEIQQTIASDSTLAQTPALSVAEGKNETTITDVKVNQLATEIEQLNKSNTTTPQTKLAKQNELLNAINSAIAKNEAALKSNPTDKKLLEQKRELATLKTQTENSIAEAQQTIAADSTLAQTPVLSKSEGKNAEQKTTITADNSSTTRAIATTQTVEKGIIQTTNNEINKLQEEVIANRKERELLQEEIENSSGKKQQNLIKEQQKTDAKNLQTEQQLIVAQKTELTKQTEQQLSSTTKEQLSNDKLLEIQHEKTKLQLAQTNLAIEQLENSTSKKKGTKTEQAIHERNQLVENLTKQEEYNETNKLTLSALEGTTLTQEDIFGLDEKRYTLSQLKNELIQTENEIINLENEKKNASKKEVQQYDDVLELKTEQYALLTRQISELAQEIKTSENNNETATIVSTRTGKIKSAKVVTQLEVSEKIKLAQTEGYEQLVAQIQQLEELEQRYNQLEDEQINTRNKIAGKIKRASVSYDENEKQLLLVEIKQESNELESLIQQLNKLKEELNTLNKQIDANPALTGKEKDILLAMAIEGLQPVFAENKPKQQIVTGIQYTTGENIYDSSNPIPVNTDIPSELTYKIQIGAFSKPVPEATFKEFNPITGEQVNNTGLIRYFVGLFGDKSTAYEAQTKVRTLGYKDAFVVAYCNGERISVALADQYIAQGKCKQQLLPETIAFESTANSTTSVNQTQNSTVQQKAKSTYHLGPKAAIASATEDTKGLFFTVQIGVFNYPISAAKLLYIEPLVTNLTEKGQIRYSTGQFDDVTTAVERKNEIRTKGIEDAFVTAYYNGVRISIAEAKKLLDEKGNGILYSKTTQETSSTIQIPTNTSDNKTINEIKSAPPKDTRKPLDEKIIKQIQISKKQYSNFPKEELESLKNSGIIAYYDSETKRIKTYPTANKNSLPRIPKNIEMVTVPLFNGFEIDTTQGNYFESLKDYSRKTFYYIISISWTGELAQTTAAYLTQCGYPVMNWNPTDKQIEFGPLNFEKKETLKENLKELPGIQIEEGLIGF